MTKTRFWINYWLPALGWNAAMAVFSSVQFGAGNTGVLFRFLLEDILRLHLSPPAFEITHFLFRKCAHFGGYALLSLLWFRLLAARAGRKRAGEGARSHEGRFHENADVRRAGAPAATKPASWKWQWFAIALGICLVTSSADEIHQTFTPGRTGAWQDVALDMLGATWMQSVLMITAQRVRRAKSW